MWRLDFKHDDVCRCIEFEMHVVHANFKDYLTNKLKNNPRHINVYRIWYRFYSPFSVKLEPDPLPKGESILLKINKPITISLPCKSLQQQYKLSDQLVDSLMTWFEDEYELYQKETKLSLCPR